MSDKITEYKLDNYTGEQDFILDNTYYIPDSLIHVFTLPSKTVNESSAKTIYAIYIGSISKIPPPLLLIKIIVRCPTNLFFNKNPLVSSSHT